jgi:hypothetical protein
MAFFFFLWFLGLFYSFLDAILCAKEELNMWQPSAFVSDPVSAAMCQVFMKLGVEVV